MRVLAIGDVTGTAGCDFLARHLRPLKMLKGADLCIVNGENSADSNGITPKSARAIFDAGADVITTGNHALRRREVYSYFDENEFLIRPYNYSGDCPGRGFVVWERGRRRVLVANFVGMTYMPPVKNPFFAAKELLGKIKQEDLIAVFDFHAEATSEKKAFGYYLDGEVSAVFGTHTHVQTADEEILPKGTGYITDLGMTGPIRSVLGVAPDEAMTIFLSNLPGRYTVADSPCQILGVCFEIDEKTRKCADIERFGLR